MGADLDDKDRDIVDNRLGRLVGLGAFALMLLRLGRLIESGGDAPAWQLIMIASAFLGAVIWWLLSQTMSNRKLATGIFVAAGMILFLRIAVPHTLIGGFIPSLDTFSALGNEMGQAIDLIRFGIAPIFPTSGVVAILSVLMWIIGGLYIWGATGGPITAMVLPSLALYLQFAVMDRVPAGRGWMGGAAVVIALSMAAVAMERRSDAGRVRDLEGRPLPRRAGSMAFVLAILIGLGSVALADTGSSLVPTSGNLQWRAGTGYGYGAGSVSYDRLADLQQQIIRRSNALLFRATLSDDAPPADQIYWRMESLDIFDGEAWRPSGTGLEYYSPARAGGDDDYSYRGTTQTISQRVAIEKLQSRVVPIAGIATVLSSDQVNTSSFQVAADGSVLYQAFLGEGEEFQAAATLALHDEDLGALASVDGELSPIFRNASEAGLFSVEPAPLPGDTARPGDIDRFLALPRDDLPTALTDIAREKTRGARTDFETAWLLQHWFRDSGDFTYSTNVTTGHGSLALENWLGDPTSPNYRTGYCEQFAAGMAVLGRLLDIPTRVVWGFTPGTVTVAEVAQTDGSVVQQEVVEIRDNNAHAWVEMWMDGVGWVKFDPTPRGDGALPTSLTADFDPVEYLPAPDDPSVRDFSAEDFLDENSTLAIDQTDNPIGGGAFGSNLSWWWLIVPALALLAAIIPMTKSVRRRRRLRRIRTGDITAAWEEIIDRLEDLGTPVPAHQTPLEFANATDRSLVPIAKSYSAAIYGGINSTATQDDFETIENWLKLRYESGRRTRAAFNPKSLFD